MEARDGGVGDGGVGKVITDIGPRRGWGIYEQSLRWSRSVCEGSGLCRHPS